MSFTSANRSSTVAAASSGTPRRRSAAASWACVRGAADSSRRQICRATSSGSASASARRPARSRPSPRSSLPRLPLASLRLRAPLWPRALCGVPPRPVLPLRSVVIDAACARPAQLLRAKAPNRGHPLLGEAQAHALLGLGVEPGTHAQLLLDLLLDLVGQVWVVAQEVAGVLLALAELVALVGVPSARLAHDALLHAEVDKSTFTANANSVQNVKFCDFEWWRYFVLHYLDACPVPDGIRSVL